MSLLNEEVFIKELKEIAKEEFYKTAHLNNSFESSDLKISRIENNIKKVLLDLEEKFKNGFDCCERFLKYGFNEDTDSKEREEILDSWEEFKSKIYKDKEDKKEEFNYEIPNKLLIHFYSIAVHLFNSKDYKNAESIYLILRYHSPFVSEFAFGTALVYLQLERWNEAEEELDKTLRIEPNHSQALIESIKLANNLQKTTKAYDLQNLLKKGLEDGIIELDEEQKFFIKSF